jgi:lipopolysaccharide biosynthesis glycosyltransferase
LPTYFNFNLAMLYQDRAVWDSYVKDAVAIHYTLHKPWETNDRFYPYSIWHEQLEKVKRKGCVT